MNLSESNTSLPSYALVLTESIEKYLLNQENSNCGKINWIEIKNMLKVDHNLTVTESEIGTKNTTQCVGINIS